jgi:hypothetical protein
MKWPLFHGDSSRRFALVYPLNLSTELAPAAPPAAPWKSGPFRAALGRRTSSPFRARGRFSRL